MTTSIPGNLIEKRIFVIRGHKVMVDRDLAELYGVATKVLNQAVKRNKKRFPADFMFRLTKGEVEEVVTICDRFGNLRSQNATSSWGGRRYTPYVFTEQGVAMLSSVLNSERAVQVNIAIMRAFVKLREVLSTHKELAQKLSELERKVEKNDRNIHLIFEAIRQLMAPPPEKQKGKIGFITD